jgi:hypothetical protein
MRFRRLDGCSNEPGGVAAPRGEARTADRRRRDTARPRGCRSQAAPVARQPPPPDADERRLVHEFNALLRGAAADVRFPVGECTTLSRRTRAELRDTPQRIAAARQTDECGQSTDNVRDSAYDEFHDLAKPHLQAFMANHNPIAAQMRATTWELGPAGLIAR